MMQVDTPNNEGRMLVLKEERDGVCVGNDSLDPLFIALSNSQLVAKVVDTDQYLEKFRLKTDYIIEVTCSVEKGKPQIFEPFSIAKSFQSFRNLAKKMRGSADSVTLADPHFSHNSTRKIKRAAESMSIIIDSEPVTYLKKALPKRAQELKSHRSLVINNALHSMVENFPISEYDKREVQEFVKVIEEFLLTDHLRGKQKVDGSIDFKPLVKQTFNPVKQEQTNERRVSIISPITTATIRQSEKMVVREEAQVDSKLLLCLSPSEYLMKFPFSMVPFFLSVFILYFLSYIEFTVSMDIVFVCLTLAFCLGSHFGVLYSKEHEQEEITTVTSTSKFIRQSFHRASKGLIKRSDSNESGSFDDTDRTIFSEISIESLQHIAPPITLSHNGISNGWYEAKASGFHVRGNNYFQDHHKVPSKASLFSVRGVELYLTDTCPLDAERYEEFVLKGRLRELPTFVVNFLLPWGILMIYFEIPERFVPFMAKSVDPELVAHSEGCTPGELATIRFISSNEAVRNRRLKLIPIVVEGPWICRSVVGGKPAIIGNKLPVRYRLFEDNNMKRPLLVANLDINSSPAGRRILSICRSYAKSLVIDIGFVVESTEQDELPEQMMGAVRLCGLDPIKAPPFPSCGTINNFMDEDTVTYVSSSCSEK